MHDSAKNQEYAHLWTEIIAKLGSREISTVADRFVKSHSKEKERLSFWCDNCGGQNKNQYIAMAMIYIVNAIVIVNVIDIRSLTKDILFFQTI